MKVAGLILMLIVWLIGPFAITLLGVGMSGGELLSPAALARDAMALDPQVLLSLVAWFVLLFPLALIWWIVAAFRSRGKA